MCYFLLYRKVIQLYIFFFIFFSITVYHKILNSSELYSRTLLFTHSIYNNLPLLIPNSQFIPPLPPPLSATTSWFSMSVSLFLFHFHFHSFIQQTPQGFLCARPVISLGTQR